MEFALGFGAGWLLLSLSVASSVVFPGFADHGIGGSYFDSSSEGNSGCALFLDGPGRSSRFDQTQSIVFGSKYMYYIFLMISS